MLDRHNNSAVPNRGLVLVVDDNPEIVLGTELRLRAAGYTPVGVYGGEQAIDVAKHQHPRAIILDVQMPDPDGFATMQRLREDPATQPIPIVMFSASLRDQHAALERGARFFLPKPCTSDHLVAAIDAALSNGLDANKMDSHLESP